MSVINIAPPPKAAETGGQGQLNQSTSLIGASQSTLKGGNEGIPIKNVPSGPPPVAQPTEEEVARIRLKISAKATYSK